MDIGDIDLNAFLSTIGEGFDNFDLDPAYLFKQEEEEINQHFKHEVPPVGVVPGLYPPTYEHSQPVSSPESDLTYHHSSEDDRELYTSDSLPSSPDLQGEPLMQEILDLISWNDDNRGETRQQTKRKRREGSSKESQQEKHKSAEKKRRSDMNEVIDDLRTLLPIEKDSKMTKLAVLHTSAEYLTRVQRLCVKLLKENKELKQQMGGNLSEEPEAKRQRTFGSSFQSHLMDGTRAVFLSLFMLMVIYVPFSPEDLQATAAGGRVILSDDYTLLSFLNYSLSNYYVWNFFRWFVFAFVSLAVMSLGERTLPVDSDEFRAGKKQVEKAEFHRLAGKFGVELEPVYREALDLLRQRPPAGPVVTFMLFSYECLRHFLHRLWVGYYLERAMLRFKGVDEQYVLEVTKATKALIKLHQQPNMEWLYLTVRSINMAELFDLNDQVEDIKLAALFRIRGHTSLTFRLVSIYLNCSLEWCHKKSELENPKGSSRVLDNDLEKHVSGMFAKMVESLTRGDLKQARYFVTQSLELSSLGTSERQRLCLTRAIAILGVLEDLDGRHKESLEYAVRLLKMSMEGGNEAGKVWAFLGLSRSLLRLGNVKGAQKALEYLDKSVGTVEQPMERLLYLIQKGRVETTLQNFPKAFELLEMIIQRMREANNDTLWYGVPSYAVAATVAFDLWEESKKETSSLHSHLSKIEQYASEISGFLHKTSCNFAVVQPRALLMKGQIHFMHQEFSKAKDCWNGAVESAQNMKLKSEEQAARELLERFSSQL